ncbi:hypothetical protein BDB00DRAFT_870001 [Zychaea mexicana]|uniref:uncharacterized protein n=1 Tax=Zychaea mexicana TaxID=64656 RepID=UPI0022FF34EA|nr:uncharacterized protein BDB00DRAFT_870001 [Zychaea mexicana]KAI9495784.1 hypothetical protein BDB00DRAFT_870001 [Zychaea mexicana]
MGSITLSSSSTLLATLYLLFIVTITTADQIFIDEPPANGIFQVNSPMDIRYHIRKNGMAGLGSTTVNIINADTHELVTDLSNATWKPNNKDLSVKSVWYIPQDLSNGTYTLRVSGT